jgi:hypothetical protein
MLPSQGQPISQNHNPKICSLTPSQMLSTRNGAIWLEEHLDCSSIADKKGKNKAHRGARSPHRTILGLSNSKTLTSCNSLAWITNTTIQFHRGSQSTEKLQILYHFVFRSYLINYYSNMHKFWWAHRSMGLLTTHQNSAQTDTVWQSNQSINQMAQFWNGSKPRWQDISWIRYVTQPILKPT